MALKSPSGLILPIGCSCLGSFELARTQRFADGVQDGHLFDWTITTPQATAEVLEWRKPFIERPEDYALFGNRIRSRRFPGLYFWHILNEGTSVTLFDTLDPIVQAFPDLRDKHAYLAGKLSRIEGDVFCIWSNIQPNLKSAIEESGLDWEAFRLTRARYARIQAAAAGLALKGARVECLFAGRAEDIDSALVHEDNVFVLDCPRGPSGQSAPGVLDPLLARIEKQMRDRAGAV